MTPERPAEDPFERFHASFGRARAAGGGDPTAVALATADARGRPSVRMVLLKEATERGFVFYTNAESRKGAELRENPHAALCFYWPLIGEQIRIEGRVERVTDAEADTYFATRARESQLGAWASRQSRPTPSHEILHERWHQVAEQHAGKPVPRPPWWYGWRIVPDAIEFWREGKHRLHHRMRYMRDLSAPDGWRAEILDP